MKAARDYLTALAAELLGVDDDRQAADLLVVAMAGGGEASAKAALNLARLIGEAAAPAEALAAIDRLDVAGEDPAVAAMRLVVACFASARADYAARQDASAARAALSARAESAYPVTGAVGPDLLDWLVRLVGATSTHLSGVAASRVPVVRVETGISLPSTLLAWELYADASRAGEIVGRNRIGTPMIMPAVFEATAG